MNEHTWGLSRTDLAAPAAELRLFALGPERIYRGGRLLVPTDWTFAKPKELLFYLLCHSSKTKEQIGLVFWPDVSPTHLRNSFRATLYHLRLALGRPEWILFEEGHYTFNHSLDYWFDVEAFETKLAKARHYQTTNCELAIHDLQEALHLYQGDFLEELDASPWYQSRREALQSLYLEGLIDLGRLLFAAGRYIEASHVFHEVITRDNLRESAHRGLMRCYARLGEPARAVRHFQKLFQSLNDELRMPPAFETVALVEHLRQGEKV